jgi:hypothetical protein
MITLDWKDGLYFFIMEGNELDGKRDRTKKRV